MGFLCQVDGTRALQVDAAGSGWAYRAPMYSLRTRRLANRHRRSALVAIAMRVIPLAFVTGLGTVGFQQAWATGEEMIADAAAQADAHRLFTAMVVDGAPATLTCSGGACAELDVSLTGRTAVAYEVRRDGSWRVTVTGGDGSAWVCGSRSEGCRSGG